VLVPFDSDAWDWGEVEHRPATHRGRDCVVASGFGVVLADVELEDGAVALDLAVGAERAFHGVVWRARDTANYESFFVRPHQVGNPDAVQYTPVFNDISCWQLYHGDGFWAPAEFPLDERFRIRVVFAGGSAEVEVGGERALLCGLKAPVESGRIGVLVGGPDVHLSEFVYNPGARPASRPSPAPAHNGVLRSWEVSDAFAEAVGERALTGERSWTRIESEPSGLVNLARVQGIRDGDNTALARTTIEAARAGPRLLEFGFSDRAVVYLNSRPLFSGDDTYRSRDYRFLGGIGWYDAVYLPLEEGANELVIAVSEDFGGWGVQARLAGG
jgi:hypothetical protein